MTADSTSPPASHLTHRPSSRQLRHPSADLFLISFLVLFFELACIRWFGSTVIFLTFFTNLVLMACFLGVSVGCLSASRPRNYIDAVVPLALGAMLLAFGVLWCYSELNAIMVDVGGQQSPQQIYFGTETRTRDASAFVVPIEAIAGVFYLLIGLMFVGLGQVMGRAFNAIPDRVAAYTTNVLGSLAGIAAFGVASFLRTTPLVWFAVSIGLCLYFIERLRMRLVAAGAGALLLGALVLTADKPTFEKELHSTTVWSPYYKIRFLPKSMNIYVNNIRHQAMYDLGKGGSFYQVLYLMNRDAGGRPYDDVLVIGAGSGNDVAAALAQGARHVDAVEIDPVLYEVGRDYHPNRPYDDPRVRPYIDDGRSFLRKQGRSYDLIVYALVDSLVLHSGYSSIRLESFLFTEQAFRDIKSRLKPGGSLVIYNYFRQGWVVGRLAKLAEDVFSTRPIVFSIPYQGAVTPRDSQGNRLSFLIVGNPSATAEAAIEKKLHESQFFWSHTNPAMSRQVNAFGPAPPYVPGALSDQWLKIGPAMVETAGVGQLPTDDYPFLYLRDPVIPALNVRGIVIVAVLSIAILLACAPVRKARPNGQMFFLGAGFMLLETKGVVHMALLFGSTWVVNSIVFAAILVMILLSNLFVLRVKPRRLWSFYALLTASLLVNLAVPMTTFLSLPGAAKAIVSCVVVFVPVFFAGVIFAASFRDSQRPDVDFGSNVGGVILGGLSEYLSLVVGFNHLLVIAIVYYLLSALFKPRWQPATAL